MHIHNTSAYDIFYYSIGWHYTAPVFNIITLITYSIPLGNICDSTDPIYTEY